MPHDLAGRIRAARALANQNQLPFAKATSIGKKRLAELESGAGEPPTENELLLIAKHADLPLAWFDLDLSTLDAVSAEPNSAEQLNGLTQMVNEGLGILREMRTKGLVELGEQVAAEVRRQSAQSSEAPRKRRDTR